MRAYAAHMFEQAIGKPWDEAVGVFARPSLGLRRASSSSRLDEMASKIDHLRY